MSTRAVTAALVINAEHAAFAGHFPGFPILPGAVLLDAALYEIARARDLDLLAWQLSVVKFPGTVHPGDILTLEHTVPNAHTVHFVIRNGRATVASGVLVAICTRNDPNGD